MSSYCSQCGGLLGSGARFCPHCGVSVDGGTIAPNAATGRWESCTIAFHEIRQTKSVWFIGDNEWECEFVAQGAGRDGSATVVARSPRFIASGSGWPTTVDAGRHKESHNALVAKLQDDGWELVETPGPMVHFSKWYGYRFKRHLRT